MLAAFPDGLTTAEVAAIMAPSNYRAGPRRGRGRADRAAAAGGARRVAVGHDALWASAELAADRLLRAASL